MSDSEPEDNEPDPAVSEVERPVPPPKKAKKKRPFWVELPILIGQYQTLGYLQNALRVPLWPGNEGLAAR